MLLLLVIAIYSINKLIITKTMVIISFTTSTVNKPVLFRVLGSQITLCQI